MHDEMQKMRGLEVGFHPLRVGVGQTASSRARRLLAVGALVALGACGGEPTAPTDLWTLDTSSWPDCGWASSTMIYTDLVDVRMHDLATGEDKVVWPEAMLKSLSGLVPPAPTFLSLSADRRWMAVTLVPLNQTRVQLLALSCDGVTGQRLGPDDASFVGRAKISPDGKKIALGHGGSSAAPDGILVVELGSAQVRAVSRIGRVFQWSLDGERLLHEYPSGSVFDDPFFLGVTTIVGDAPDVRTQREVLLDTSCAWDTDDGAICSDVDETQKWPFDDGRPIERIAPGIEKMARAADGTIYGLTATSKLVELDMATQTWNRVGPATSIARYAL